MWVKNDLLSTRHLGYAQKWAKGAIWKKNTYVANYVAISVYALGSSIFLTLLVQNTATGLIQRIMWYFSQKHHNAQTGALALPPTQ
jgi:hypothetical protein